MDTASLAPAETRRAAGRLFFWLGIAVGVLAVAGYVVQILYFKYLVTPWYLPFVGTLGLVLLLAAVMRQRSWGRILASGFFVLLAGFEWLFVFVFCNLPGYDGPVSVGYPFPEFTTSRADGSPVSRDLFRNDKHNTVLVFFRGRW